MDIEDYDSVIAVIEKMEKAVYKKGRHHWYDKNGKLIINGHNEKETYNELINIIKNDKENYINGRLCHVRVQFYTDEKILSDENMGAMELTAVIYHVKEFKNKISLITKDDETTIVRLFYYLDDFKQFKLGHMKKLALLLLNGKIKGELLKYYHYTDIKSKLADK